MERTLSQGDVTGVSEDMMEARQGSILIIIQWTCSHRKCEKHFQCSE